MASRGEVDESSVTSLLRVVAGASADEFDVVTVKVVGSLFQAINVTNDDAADDSYVLEIGTRRRVGVRSQPRASVARYQQRVPRSVGRAGGQLVDV